MIALVLIIISSTHAEEEEVKLIKKRFYNYQLPEVIINKDLNNQGYVYPIPSVPFDDVIPIPPQDYIPTFNPPLNDPSNDYLPPTSSYGPPNFKSSHVRIINMSCMENRSFKTTVQAMSFRDFPPVIDDSKINCIQGSGDIYQINVEANQLSDCGVVNCDKNMCVHLRIPTVANVKLPEDVVVILQCTPQDSVASHVKQLSFKPQIVQGRSLGSIAAGGMQRNFESQVVLYRRTAGGRSEFAQIVSPGSSVQLGEDLLIRATVRDGDGWKFSRMGSVVMQQVNGITSRKSLTLVDNTGCRVNSMRSICPEQPRQINPLVTTMPFRAFMFQGGDQGEMLLTVRMYGCLQKEDCDQHCEEKVQGRIRAKRETENGTSLRKADWESHLDFKVVPKLQPIQKKIMDEDALYSPVILLAGVCGVIFMSVLMAVALRMQRM